MKDTKFRSARFVPTAFASVATAALMLGLGATTALAQVVAWDGGAGTQFWGDAPNWSDDTVPNSNTKDVEFLNNIATGAISFASTATPAPSNRTIQDLIIRSSQTNALTLGTVAANNFLTARNVTLETGAGNLTIGRLTGAASARTLTVTHASQILTMQYDGGVNSTTGTVFAGAGTTRLNWINNTQAFRNITINANARLEITGNLGVTGGNNVESPNLLNGSGTLAAFGASRTAAFGRKGTSSATFSGTLADSNVDLTHLLNIEIGGNTTATSQSSRSNFSGTQTFSGNNTYTGTTTVNQGTLLVNGTHTGGGNYLVRGTTSTTDGGVAKTGTLGGTGTIGLANNATFTIGGTQLAGSMGVLRPGADGSDTTTLTIGTALNSNSVIFGDASVLRLDIGMTLSDRLAINGALNLNSTLDTLDLLSLTGAGNAGSTYTLATFTGALTGIFNTVKLDNSIVDANNFALGSNNYKVVYGINSIQLQVVPEPSIAGMLLCGFGLLIGFQRTRRNRSGV